jgi:hypothetical protein
MEFFRQGEIVGFRLRDSGHLLIIEAFQLTIGGLGRILPIHAVVSDGVLPAISRDISSWSFP